MANVKNQCNEDRRHIMREFSVDSQLDILMLLLLVHIKVVKSNFHKTETTYDAICLCELG